MTYSLFDSYRSLKGPVKSVMDDLVMLRKSCKHTHTHILIARILQKIS